MQQLDDDMDELFREAAARYPLKIDGANWDAIQSRLQQYNKPTEEVKPAHNFRWLWLLLLLPLFFIAHLSTQHKYDNNIQNKRADLLSQEQPEPTSRKDIQQILTGKEQANHQTELVIGQTAKAEQKEYAGQNEPTGGPAVQQFHLAHKQESRQANPTGKQPFHQTDLNRTPLFAQTDLIGAQGDLQNKSAGVKANQQVIPEKKDATSDSNTNTQFARQVVPQANTQDTTTGSPVKLVPDRKAVLKNKKESTVKGWYAGFIVSPDISVVKWQKPSKPGYGLGIIAGYSFSKRLSVETGLLWDRKYYYSTGEHLNPEKVPSNWNILDIDGWCRMFEIPVQARYTFSIRKQHSWYVNAGLSSYIMNRENYDYSYNRYGAIAKGNAIYDNETQNWFSVIHTGIGYERRLGGIGNMRIEPYIKIPVTGLGWGGLPITSFGLNIGITKPLR